jgi:putative membrane protein insertion efficiency factor
MVPAQPVPHREHPSPQAGMKKRAIAFAFRSYKSLISPAIHAVAPSRCLYLPTCSEYAYTALLRFGIVRGSWLALRRILRCHPWGKGGFDPLPGMTPSPKPDAEQKPTVASTQSIANHLP